MVHAGSLGRQMLPDGSTAPATLYALGGNGIVTSPDGGENWNEATAIRTWNQGPGEFLLAVDPSLPDIGVYVATICCPPLDPPEVEPLLQTWRSIDGGVEFAEVTGQAGFARSIAFDNHAPKTVYLASDQQALRSQDDGETWEPAPGNGLPVGLHVGRGSRSVDNPSQKGFGTRLRELCISRKKDEESEHVSSEVVVVPVSCAHWVADPNGDGWRGHTSVSDGPSLLLRPANLFGVAPAAFLAAVHRPDGAWPFQAESNSFCSSLPLASA